MASLVAGSSGDWATGVLVQAEIKAVLVTAVFKLTAGFTRDKKQGLQNLKITVRRNLKLLKEGEPLDMDRPPFFFQNSWLLNLSNYFLLFALS